MKKIISWILTVAIIASFACTAAMAAGVEVATAEELAAAVKSGAGVITVTSDITLTETLEPTADLVLVGKGDVTLTGTCGTFIKTAEDLTVENLTVSGATASAIVMTDGALKISNSVFSGNSGEKGGAVFFGAFEGAAAEEEQLPDNVIVGVGGTDEAASDRSVTIINSVFENNTAAGNGGAINIAAVNTTSITNSLFEGNKAAEGGAIYAYTEWNIMQFVGTTFKANTAKGGGAVRNVNGSVEAWDSAFESNKATEYHGGAVYGWHLYVVLHDCTVSGNTAKGNGGAIWVETTDGWPANQFAEIVVHGGEVTNNTAGGQGGAIGGQNLALGITIDGGALVDGNKATEAGALYCWAGIYINDSTVSNNRAEQNGGVIWCNWEVKANNSTFTKNYCKWFGGVAYGMLGDMVFNNCTFKNNTADPYFRGGAAVACNYQMNIYSNDCTYSGNRAWGSKDLVAQQGSVVYGSAPAGSAAEASKSVINVTVQAEKGYNIFSIDIPGATENNGVYSVVTENGTGVDIDISAVMTATRTCTVEQFVDISEKMEYHRAVDYVVENKLMDGTGNNQFSPDVYTTRGMIVTILYRMEGCPDVTFEKKYSDVPEGEWYSDAVIWASNNGIVNGYDNGKFGPADLVTTEQLAAILYRYATVKGKDVSASAELGTEYANAEEVSGYAVDAMKWVSAKNLFDADNTNPVDVKGNVARIKLAVALYAMSF